MKIKFLILSFLLLTARGCDWYTTVLATNNLADEVNPLTTVLGFGWVGLALTNILIVGGIIWLAWYQIHRYKRKEVSSQPQNVFQYISACYYDRLDRFYWVLFKNPKDKKPMMGHLGYSLIRTMTLVSIFAAIHNYCRWHRIEAYLTFSEWIGSPVKFIWMTAALMVFGLMFFIANQEYKDLKNNY